MKRRVEISLLKQTAADLKLRAAELNELVEEYGKAEMGEMGRCEDKDSKEPTLKVGDKVLVLGGKENYCLLDGVYPYVKGDSNNALGLKVNTCISRTGVHFIVKGNYDIVQPLLSGPFDASRIPADQIPGYMVWVEVYGKNGKEQREVSEGWQSIEYQNSDNDIIVCSATFNPKGEYNDAKYAQLHFQPPEQPKVNAEPSDELLLQVIKEMPWLPEWCRSGESAAQIYDYDCPHGCCSGLTDCPQEESVCFKIFNTHAKIDCPCDSIGKLAVQTIKDRIIKLAEKNRTYKIGDCIEIHGASGTHPCILSNRAGSVAAIVIGDWDTGNTWSTHVEVRSTSHITTEEVKKITWNKDFTYLGPFNEVFTRRI